MKILIISSCTGEKKLHFKEQLGWDDFQRGKDYIAAREKEFARYLLPAEDLYIGQQHIRLMQAIRQLREDAKDQVSTKSQSPISNDTLILSAGYGLIPLDRKILPYEATFTKLTSSELSQWATTLDIPRQFRAALQQDYDLAIVILGEKYWQACDMNQEISVSMPVVAFCNKPVERKIRHWNNVYPISLANADGKRFKCNLIGLKGELTARLLMSLQEGSIDINQLQQDPSTTLDRLDDRFLALPPNPEAALVLPLPHIDQVIHLSDAWKHSPHRQKMRYFIPDWEDLVDPDYNFDTDEHANGKGGWPYELYAHQIYEQPNYDGILVSKVTIDEDARRRARMGLLGVHRYLRVPPEFPVMGDCGAFGYFKEEKPPYTTEEVLDYYTNYGFDLGVSVDHIIIDSHDKATKQYRYDLTVQNAEDFLREHRRRKLPWTPMGAVQGWDPDSYAQAAAQYVNMGYKYLAIGGLVKRNTAEVMRIAEKVASVIPRDVQLHLFGIARLNALRLLQQMGVTSVDSASYLRKAWLGAKDNYYTLDGTNYAAIRIPEVEKSSKAKKAHKERNISLDLLKSLELEALQAIRDFDNGLTPLNKVLDILVEYDTLLNGQPNKSLLKAYRRTLESQPWKKCPCSICKKHGIEVILFRNNNRNRRRGFHNTFVFFEQLMDVLNDTSFFVNEEHKLFENHYLNDKTQMELYF